MTTVDPGGFSAAQRLGRALNDALAIDAAAEHAMLVGCLRGWHCEAADPDFLRTMDRRLMNAARPVRGRGVMH